MKLEKNKIMIPQNYGAVLKGVPVYIGDAQMNTVGYLDLSKVIFARVRFRKKELGIELFTAYDKPFFISNETIHFNDLVDYFGLDYEEISKRAEDADIYKNDELIGG